MDEWKEKWKHVNLRLKLKRKETLKLKEENKMMYEALDWIIDKARETIEDIEYGRNNGN